MRKCLKEYLVKAMLLKINNVWGSEPLRKGFLWCRNYDVIRANTFTRKEYEKVFQIQSGRLKFSFFWGLKFVMILSSLKTIKLIIFGLAILRKTLIFQKRKSELPIITFSFTLCLRLPMIEKSIFLRSVRLKNNLKKGNVFGSTHRKDHLLSLGKIKLFNCLNML